MWTCKDCECWNRFLLDQEISPGSQALADLPRFFTSDLFLMACRLVPCRGGWGRAACAACCLHWTVFGDEYTWWRLLQCHWGEMLVQLGW